jgi:hypothetical protein
MTESRRHSPVSAAETEPGPMLLKIPPENWRRSWLGPAALAATTETRVGGCPLAGPSRRRLWHRRPNAELSQSMTTTFNFRIDAKLRSAAKKAAALDQRSLAGLIIHLLYEQFINPPALLRRQRMPSGQRRPADVLASETIRAMHLSGMRCPRDLWSYSAVSAASEDNADDRVRPGFLAGGD